MRVTVPLVTPYTDDTSQLSEVRMARVVRFHMDHGAEGFLYGSEASEGQLLGHAERKQAVEWVVRESHGLPVYVDVTANSTAAMVDLAQHAGRHGARGAVFTAPFHLSLHESEVASLVSALIRHGNLPCAMVGRGSDVEGSLALLKLEDLPEDARVLRRPNTEEWAHDGLTATPLGVLAADLAALAFDAWDRVGEPLRHLWSHGGSHRVGKAALERLGCAVGPPRGPLQPLETKAEQVLAGVLDALRPPDAGQA